MKTGSLFAAAAELGAMISGSDPETARRFKRYGTKLGAAYQIYDDCLDIAGTENATGKTLGTDLRKGKLTLPVLVLLQAASASERERCCALILDGKSEAIADLLTGDRTNGALGSSIESGQKLVGEAQSELESVPPNEHVDSLVQLGDALHELLDQLRV